MTSTGAGVDQHLAPCGQRRLAAEPADLRAHRDARRDRRGSTPPPPRGRSNDRDRPEVDIRTAHQPSPRLEGVARCRVARVGVRSRSGRHSAGQIRRRAGAAPKGAVERNDHVLVRWTCDSSWVGIAAWWRARCLSRSRLHPVTRRAPLRGRQIALHPVTRAAGASRAVRRSRRRRPVDQAELWASSIVARAWPCPARRLRPLMS